jgi:cytochrome bd-type quinol oxidase subunit 2
MREPAKLYLRVLWIGTALFVAGIALDQRWHATHDEFEGTAQQFEAHWLLWLGFLVVLVATLLAFARLHARERHPGLAIVLAASAVYLAVTVWHFVAHANEVDPDVAHVLLALCDAALIAGAGWTVVGWIRTRSGSSRVA